MGDLQVIQNLLILYEHALRQQVNRGKTIVFFSKVVL